MARYLQRSCPKCNGYLGIVLPKRKAKMPVQGINGRCLKCGYRLALVRGKTSAEARRKPFQRLVHPGAQKRKTALKLSGRSLQSSETFVSELSFRTSSGVTAQGTVAPPARLPQPFQVAPNAGVNDTRTGTSKSNSRQFFQGLDLPGCHVFEKSTARFSK
jgi:hypothetical protein